jgi:hypothetical protein
MGSVHIGAQTTTIIPANLAAGHIGRYATVEGVVAKVFTSGDSDQCGRAD